MPRYAGLRTGMPVARLQARGAVTALASSTWHPSVVLGTADGWIFSTNYLRQFIPRTRTADSSDAFTQKLCEYEWISTNSLGKLYQI